MIVVTGNMTIDAPVEMVWDFMANLGTMPERDPAVVDVRWDPPLHVGSVATVTFRRMGARTGKYEVKEWEPGRRFRVQMTALGARIDGTWEFVPADGRKTKASVLVLIDVHGLMRIIAPYLSYHAKRDASAGFARIRRAIEARWSQAQMEPPSPGVARAV